jgi:metallophosphoesterase (TIGR00282 family)
MRVLKALMLGDLVGSPGVGAFLWAMENRLDLWKPDIVVVNAENAASDGIGVYPQQIEALFQAGANVVTSGNHIWEKKEIITLLDSCDRILRPENYPSSLPGKGRCTLQVGESLVTVINLQGRSRMTAIDNPFVPIGKVPSSIVLVDFHAEDPLEKEAIGYFLDGKVSAVVGTHTHVATKDFRILPGGTAFISDLGMCGPLDSVIGAPVAPSIARTRTMVGTKASVAEGRACVRGVLIEIDCDTGFARNIESIHEIATFT